MSSLQFTLVLDKEKSADLKRGKKVFKDDDGHRIYLTKDEDTKLESPEEVVMEVRAS